VPGLAALLLLVGLGIESMHERVMAGSQAAILAVRIESQANLIAALEVQAMEEASEEGHVNQELVDRIGNTRRAAEKQVKQLVAGPLAGARSIDFDYQRYVDSVALEINLLTVGGLDAARTTQSLATEPRLERLEQSIDSFRRGSERFSARTELQAEIGTVAILLLAGLLTTGFVIALLRARRSADRAALERRLIEVANEERRALLHEVVGASERERAVLAGDLHDGPIQRLTAITYRLPRIRRRVSNGDDEGAAALLEEVGETLSGEIDSLRRVMSALRPPPLTEGGLPRALHEQARLFQPSIRVECSVDEEAARLLDLEKETILLRVAQEAVANASKHAQASAILIDLSAEESRVTLTVADDGVGFDTDRAHDYLQAGHFGLAMMRERVEMAGGSLEIRAAPGRGTSVVVAVPLSAAESNGEADQPPTASSGLFDEPVAHPSPRPLRRGAHAVGESEPEGPPSSQRRAG
jgi:signal transduction histidine kinase